MYDPPHVSWAFAIAIVACLGCFINLGVVSMVDDDYRGRRRRRSSDSSTSSDRGRRGKREVELVAVIQTPAPAPQALPPHFQVGGAVSFPAPGGVPSFHAPGYPQSYQYQQPYSGQA